MLPFVETRSVRGLLVPALLMLLFRGGAWVMACPLPEGNSEREQALKRRVQEFYSLLQTGNRAQAEPFLTADSVETFRTEKNVAFAGFEIQSLKLEPDGTSATVQVQIESFSPLFPAPLPMLLTNRWVLADGVWRFTIPKQSVQGISPFKSEARNTPSPAAELKFKGHRYHFGRIIQGQVKVARFPFANETTHVVRIADVVTGCDCLTVKLPKKEYQPGESGTLEVRFDSSGHTYVYGQTVVLKTDPGTSPEYLTVDAIIDPAPRLAQPQASQEQSKPAAAPPSPKPNGP
jgi:uncharacterized protein DUF1573